MTAIEPEHPHMLERIVALTRDLILIPGTHRRPDDLERCSRFVQNHLEAVEGITVQRFVSGGIPSLVAGPSEPDVLLCAHLDVIDHANPEVYQSTIRDGRIYGPGAGDMKGALAIALEAFREVHERIPRASLGIAVTADEEIGGEHGLGYLVAEAGVRCGSAMIPDGGAPDRITIEEKGILHLRLHCAGQAAHAARPWLGVNPIERLMDGLARLREHFDDEGEPGGDDHWVPTCSITIIGTRNQSINRIPSDATAQLDIRFPPPHSVDTLCTRVREILGAGIAVEPIISAKPTHLSPDPAYRAIGERILGRPVHPVREAGGSDARFLCAQGIPVIMSRPEVGNLHAENEWIDIQSMQTFYRICLSYLLQKLA